MFSIRVSECSCISPNYKASFSFQFVYVLSLIAMTTTNLPQVRTLFVSGLPMDVRLRELYLLFRCYEVQLHTYLCTEIE